MRTDHPVALKLRLSGKSYTEIQRTLGVPKSTLSSWFTELLLSDELRSKINQRGRKNAIELLIRRNKAQTTYARARARDIRRRAAASINAISVSNLQILGAALYWAEGYKRPKMKNGQALTHHPVSLTNSDPMLIKMFLRFLRECCSVPEQKIKAALRIYEHHNPQHLQRFWEKVTGIRPENFHKTYYGVSRSSLHKRPYNRLPYGVIQVVVADTQLYHKIMGYIEGLQKFV